MFRLLDNDEEEIAMQIESATTKKEKRAQKKAQRLVAEYQVTLSNDEVKRVSVR